MMEGRGEERVRMGEEEAGQAEMVGVEPPLKVVEGLFSQFLEVCCEDFPMFHLPSLCL